MSNFIKQTCKTTARQLLRWSLPLTRKVAQQPIILFFHGVTERMTNPRIQTVQLHVGMFEEMIRFIKQNHTVIGIDDLVALAACREKIPKDIVVLTFDDGYRNNLTTVAPILNSFDLPFSVYISTRHISDGRRFPTYIARVALFYTHKPLLQISACKDVHPLQNEGQRESAFRSVVEVLKTSPLSQVEVVLAELVGLLSADEWAELNGLFESDQPMTWAEVKALANRKAVIGSHCHDHAILHAQQPRAEVERQLELSRKLIEENIGPCRHFVYPNGNINDVSPEAWRCVRRAGYLSGMTTVPGTVAQIRDMQLLPRCSFESAPAFVEHRIKAGFRGESLGQTWQSGIVESGRAIQDA